MIASNTRLRFCELHIGYAAQVLVADTYTTIFTKDSAYLQAIKVIFSQFYDIIQISILLLHLLYMLKMHDLVP